MMSLFVVNVIAPGEAKTTYTFSSELRGAWKKNVWNDQTENQTVCSVSRNAAGKAEKKAEKNIKKKYERWKQAGYTILPLEFEGYYWSGPWSM